MPTTEPMDDEDSFNNPVPRSVPLKSSNLPYSSQAPPLPPPKEKDEEDVDSDDSFENFVQTQTTGGGSIKSSASSTQSTELKNQPPPKPTVPQTFPFRPQPILVKPTIPSSSGPPNLHQQSISKQYPPTLQRSQCSHAPFQSTQKVQPPPAPTVSQSFRLVSTLQPPTVPTQQQSTVGKGIHSAVTNTRNGDVQMTQKPTASSSSSSNSQGGQASPNSLARHRSANSGLRNNPFHTPAFRSSTGGNIFGPKISPSIDTQQRPVTPSGDMIMLRDQLENEKRKTLRIQAEFQKDSQKKDEEHQRVISLKESTIERQKKEIEMLKASMACRPPMLPPPPSPIIAKPQGPTPPSITSNIKKVPPKFPSSESKGVKTPRRTMGSVGHISAFRHPFKEEMDDTFEMNTSFEPSATSTPKLSGLVRTGIRRPLDLGLEDGTDVNARGAPTPKRKAAFKEERKKRSKKELDELIRKIQKEIDPEQLVFKHDEPKTSKKPAEKPQTETPDLLETDDFTWINKHLARKLKITEYRKTHEKPERLKELRPGARNRILKTAEVRKEFVIKCRKCEIPIPAKSAEEVSKILETKRNSKKEWEQMEQRRVELGRKGAEEMRNLHYNHLINSINRRGIDEFNGMTKRNQKVEEDYERKCREVKPRSLAEIREEKRVEWHRQVMEKLEESGEFLANTEIKETGRNDDYIWTEDEDEEDWMFPQPYHHPRSSLCSDCQIHQKRQRRYAKKERAKMEVQFKCFEEYGTEKREQLRNQSILTKSRIEAADKSLFRRQEVQEEEDEDAVFMDQGYGDEEDDEGFF